MVHGETKKPFVNLSSLEYVPWETRNLGMPAFGVAESFLKQPQLVQLEGDLAVLKQELPRFFVQARVSDQDHLEAIGILQKVGFFYVETVFTFVMRLKHHPLLAAFCSDPQSFLPKRYRGRLEAFLLRSSEDPNLAGASELLRGAFSYDRFHRDPHCPERIADQRFGYWLLDLLNDSKARIVTFFLDTKMAGVGILRDAEIVLAAAEKSWQRSGLGSYGFLWLLRMAKESGHREAYGVVSVHNIPMVRLLLRHTPLLYAQTQVTLHYWYLPVQQGESLSS
ncbi:hypothetical protein [Candidatus Methylacidithermus pantelleriae]|uniref:Uncharacterized protein n=1 Tax=Candidatus Methylacidithermus pantelleriae TaxID=2744239 RepID=A0A8J2BGI1_9BACT|nr:hypothetical protein [Candidatus Methylacidithermus pantelleriae]CAF0691489.1 hypothetical protein MPNT_100063 [Candidatus Methylacidithermus pantelleriae]